MDERLKKFVRIVDMGSFTKAAADLHISQPALTITIKNLERDMGAQLLLRNGKRFAMTTAGTQVYKTAKEIEDRMYNLDLRLRQIIEAEPIFSIGMIDSIAEASFVYSDGFNKLEGSKISLVVDNSTRLIAEVEQGKNDIAFVTQPTTRQSPALNLQHLGKEPLVIVTKPSNADKVKKQINTGLLVNFISYNKASTTDNLLQNELVKRGVEPYTAFYSTSPEVVLKMVLASGGVAVLPFMMVREQVKDKLLATVPIKGSCIIDRKICMVIRRNRRLAAPIAEIVKHVQQTIDYLYSESAALNTSDYR